MRVCQHIETLWGRFWPLLALPPLVLAGYVIAGQARIEHYVVILGIMGLSVISRPTRDLLLAVAPGIGIFIGYEAVRGLRPFFANPDRVLACQVRDLDAALFGFGSGLAPADVFALHHGPVADLVFALPYTVFWAVVIAYCGVLFLISPGRLRRYLWVLALMHLTAFAIWMVLPVAPPWYVRTAGCAIDLSVPPQAAALARLDAAFGITYFEAFYSRAPSVFGAFPSLHVAFPAVAMVTGWRWFGPLGRAVTVALTLWMIAASVYLDHHWLIDGLATLAIVLGIHTLLLRLWSAYRTPGARALWREGAR